MSNPKHAPGTGEFAVCGLAFDAFDSGHVDAEVLFAEANQAVTCRDCKATIDYVRKNFRGYRYAPDSAKGSTSQSEHPAPKNALS